MSISGLEIAFTVLLICVRFNKYFHRLLQLIVSFLVNIKALKVKLTFWCRKILPDNVYYLFRLTPFS